MGRSTIENKHNGIERILFSCLLICLCRSHIQPNLPTLHRSALDQAMVQAVSLLVTLLLSMVSGALTGLLIKLIGRSGSSLPVEAWYDGTCFLDTPVKSRERERESRA